MPPELELFTAKQDTLMTMEERLSLVTVAVGMMKSLLETKVYSEDDIMSWFVGDLSCFTFGQASMEFHRTGDMDDYKACRSVLDKAQFIWDVIVNYLKDTEDIELHPLAMLMVLMVPYANDDDESPMKRAILDKRHELLTEIPKEFETVDVPDIPEINNSEDVDWLSQEFFRLMLDIGTFHRDRDAYTDEESRQKHDRLVAIYYRLGELKI